MPPGKIDLEQAFASFAELFSPRIAARVNDYALKLGRARGEFVWHKHDDTDELFMVHKGTLTIRFRDGDVTLAPGELLVIPRGVEHCPVADEEVELMMFEP